MRHAAAVAEREQSDLQYHRSRGRRILGRYEVALEGEIDPAALVLETDAAPRLHEVVALEIALDLAEEPPVARQTEAAGDGDLFAIVRGADQRIGFEEDVGKIEVEAAEGQRRADFVSRDPEIVAEPQALADAHVWVEGDRPRTDPVGSGAVEAGAAAELVGLAQAQDTSDAGIEAPGAGGEKLVAKAEIGSRALLGPVESREMVEVEEAGLVEFDRQAVLVGGIAVEPPGCEDDLADGLKDVGRALRALGDEGESAPRSRRAGGA